MTTLLDALQRGVQIYDLAHPLENGMPSSPNHPGFRMSLMRRHGDMVRADGSSAANEMFVTGGHVGTHVDALSHVSYQGCLHGGIDANEAQIGGKFSAYGVDTIEPMVCRGVLLDVAAAKGVKVLDAGYGVTAADLAAAAQFGNAAPKAGDVALVRTGWSMHWTSSVDFLGADSGVPGVAVDGADWLAATGVRATGADTIAYEQIEPGAQHRLLPVHRTLLVERGIHIIEVMNLEEISAAGVYEFVFVLTPLKITGATGSPVRPLAVVNR